MKTSFLLSILLFASLSAQEKTLIETPLPPIPEGIVDPLNFSKLEPSLGEPVPNMNLKPKTPAIAIALATLYPGLGHLYLKDYSSAAIFAGGSIAGYGLALSVRDNSISESIFVTTANLRFYNIYSAYRDARMQPGLSGYKYKMPVDSLAELTFAPFNPKILKKTEVWGGLAGSLGLAAAIIYFAFPKEPKKNGSNLTQLVYAPTAFPIGIGEETFFRGFLMPAFSEVLGLRGGLIASSILFGAAHIPNGFDFESSQRKRYFTLSISFITGLGAYFGWLTQKTGSLQEAVAIHSLYDFVLFSSGAFASILGASIAGNTYSISIPF